MDSCWCRRPAWSPAAGPGAPRGWSTPHPRAGLPRLPVWACRAAPRRLGTVLHREERTDGGQASAVPSPAWGWLASIKHWSPILLGLSRILTSRKQLLDRSWVMLLSSKKKEMVYMWNLLGFSAVGDIKASVLLWKRIILLLLKWFWTSHWTDIPAFSQLAVSLRSCSGVTAPGPDAARSAAPGVEGQSPFAAAAELPTWETATNF